MNFAASTPEIFSQTLEQDDFYEALGHFLLNTSAGRALCMGKSPFNVYSPTTSSSTSSGSSESPPSPTPLATSSTSESLPESHTDLGIAFPSSNKAVLIRSPPTSVQYIDVYSIGHSSATLTGQVNGTSTGYSVINTQGSSTADTFAPMTYTHLSPPQITPSHIDSGTGRPSGAVDNSGSHLVTDAQNNPSPDYDLPEEENRRSMTGPSMSTPSYERELTTQKFKFNPATRAGKRPYSDEPVVENINSQTTPSQSRKKARTGPPPQQMQDVAKSFSRTTNESKRRDSPREQVGAEIPPAVPSASTSAGPSNPYLASTGLPWVSVALTDSAQSGEAPGLPIVMHVQDEVRAERRRRTNMYRDRSVAETKASGFKLPPRMKTTWDSRTGRTTASSIVE